MTPEQQRAMALARARRRKAEAAATQANPMEVERQGPPQPARQQGFLTKADAAIRGAADIVTFGYADEIAAGLGTGFGYLGDYQKALARERATDTFDSEHNASARLAGQISGAVASVPMLARSGLSIAGRSLPGIGKTGAMIADGTMQGALYGAGSAKEGERGTGAAMGAATGGIASYGLAKAGNKLARMAADRAARAATPATQELAQASSQLYRQAEAAGIVVKPHAVNRLAANIEFVAGRINTALRPQTAGIVQDVAALKGQPMTLEVLDELRQQIGDAMSGASPADVRVLERMKRIIDTFADNAKPADIAGDIAGFDAIKQARALYARRMKTEAIEKLIDVADVKAGSGGMASSVRQRAQALYGQILSGRVKHFNVDEIAAIRDLAKGKQSAATVRLLAAAAPRSLAGFTGGTSAGGSTGAIVGGLLGGPLGAAIGAGTGAIAAPVAGAVAGKSADRSAMRAAQALRDAVARGSFPAKPISPLSPYGGIAGRMAASGLLGE